jgi:hypothetical protein
MPNTNIESLESHREAEQKPADPQPALDALRQQLPVVPPVAPAPVVPVAPAEGQGKAE